MRMTKLFGKNIEHVYSVENNRLSDRADDEAGVMKFSAKPKLKEKDKIVKWEQICEYEGYPAYTDDSTMLYKNKTVNISENEEVEIEKEIFRADLNEYHLFTDKVLSEKDVDKLESEVYYEKLVKNFNKSMILSNQEMKEHCDLYKLSYEETDCELLFKKLFPRCTYKIVDGKMVKHEPISASKIENYCNNLLSNTSTSALTVSSHISTAKYTTSVKE